MNKRMNIGERKGRKEKENVYRRGREGREVMKGEGRLYMEKRGRREGGVGGII